MNSETKQNHCNKNKGLISKKQNKRLQQQPQQQKGLEN